MKNINLVAFGIGVVLIFVITGCSTLIPRNPNSYVQKKEIVRIETVKITKEQKKEKALPVLAAAAIPIIVDFVVTRTAAELKKEAKRYSATWSGFVADDNFYFPDDYSISLREIVVKRFADGDVTTPVFEAHLKLLQSADELAFRLMPVSVKINKTKAKLTRWDNDVDVDLKIEIEALYSNNERVENIDIGDLDIQLRNLEIGKEWKPDAQQPITSQWFPAIPISKSANGKRIGTGNYVVKVHVFENDDFGKNVEKVADFLSANREKIKEQIKP